MLIKKIAYVGNIKNSILLLCLLFLTFNMTVLGDQIPEKYEFNSLEDLKNFANSNQDIVYNFNLSNEMINKFKTDEELVNYVIKQKGTRSLGYDCSPPEFPKPTNDVGMGKLTASGHALIAWVTHPPIKNINVRIVEYPSRRMKVNIPIFIEPLCKLTGICICIGSIKIAVKVPIRCKTNEKGYFIFRGLKKGMKLTFQIGVPPHLFPQDLVPTRTETFTVPSKKLTDCDFQVPELWMVGAMETVIDPSAGSIWNPLKTGLIVSTVHIKDDRKGVADCTVEAIPKLSKLHGPIYFGQPLGGDTPLPKVSLQKTSEDGGVIFINVPPGAYTLRATHDTKSFKEVTVKVAAGIITNACPLNGLEQLQIGDDESKVYTRIGPILNNLLND